jgi:hypothetical protein
VILYVYAIADRLADLGGMTRSGEEPLEIITVESMVIVVAERAATPATARASLEAQDRIVRALHERAPALLPARFGTAFRSYEELTRAIATQRDRLRAQLDEVRGREQMTLRVLGAAGAGATGGTSATGAAYLAARAMKTTPALIVPMLEKLEPVVRATRVEVGRSKGLIASVYQLIDRGESDRYRVLAAEAARTTGDASVRISGPSPCYAFA